MEAQEAEEAEEAKEAKEGPSPQRRRERREKLGVGEASPKYPVQLRVGQCFVGRHGFFSMRGFYHAPATVVLGAMGPRPAHAAFTFAHLNRPGDDSVDTLV